MARQAYTFWSKGKRHVRFLELPSPDNPNASVSYLSKIGSITDWDQQQIENKINGVILGRCKPHVQADED